jgi:hypothetical protein
MSDTKDLDDRAFAERIVARIQQEGGAADEAMLKEALLVGRAPVRARRSSKPMWGMLLAAAAGALIAWGVTFALTRDEVPVAFDGGVGRVEAGASEVVRDERGRLLEVTTRGAGGDERLVFRSGRLVRVEQRRDGKAHGVAVDFDGSGRVVAVKTWADGVERGPWFEVGPSGIVERSGVAE